MCVHLDQIVELLMSIAHRSRLDFERKCPFEELVPHEVLLLRAVEATRVKGRDLSRALAWSPGRVSQVADALVKKEMLLREPRTKRLTKTGSGAREAEAGGYLLAEIGATLLDGFSYEERVAIEETFRRIAKNSEGLRRPTRDVL